MTKISNKETAYVVKSPIAGSDFFPLTNSENNAVGLAMNQTVSGTIDGIRDYVIAGLSPETGGTFKTTEIEIATLDTDVSTTVNAMSPAYEVLAYEMVFFLIDGVLYILKSNNTTIGIGQTALSNSDFITIPTMSGEAGNGIASIVLTSTIGLVKTYTITFTDTTTFVFTITDGTDYTANNLQVTLNASFSLSNAHNNYTIMIDNGSSDINITVPTGLMDKIAVGFFQLGSGNVTFVESGTTINSPSSYKKIKGQDYWCYLEKIGSTEVFQLAGEITA